MNPTIPKASFDVEAWREHFPALRTEIDGKRLVYLDSACTALKSRRVSERLADFYSAWGGCGGRRSTHLMSHQVEQWFQESRQSVAKFLRAQTTNEIIFTSGTTEGANFVAAAFPYEASRREVIITDLEHNAVALPFIEAANRGAINLKICPTEDGRLDLNRLAGMLSPKTALLAITHASNVMGGVLPVAEAAKLARRVGARTFVDDAQYLGTHREDVSTLGADFVAFSGHKLGGPFGLGVLWGRETELNRLGRYKVGGGTIKSLEWEGSDALPQATYLDAPMGLESGVPNISGAIGLREALMLRETVDEAALRAHVAALVRRLYEGLKRIPQVRVLGHPQDLESGGLVSFAPVHLEFSPVDMNLYLNNELPGRFIAVRVGEHCAHLLHRRLGVATTVRASLAGYNTADEVDQYLDAVRSYAREACGG